MKWWSCLKGTKAKPDIGDVGDVAVPKQEHPSRGVLGLGGENVRLVVWREECEKLFYTLVVPLHPLKNLTGNAL